MLEIFLSWMFGVACGVFIEEQLDILHPEDVERAKGWLARLRAAVFRRGRS